MSSARKQKASSWAWFRGLTRVHPRSMARLDGSETSYLLPGSAAAGQAPSAGRPATAAAHFSCCLLFVACL